ncbi:MAG: hypothetical protein ACR5K9_10635, partial [Wolbachia sp.]
LFHPIILILMPFKPRLFYLLQYWLFLYCCPSVCCVMGFGINTHDLMVMEMSKLVKQFFCEKNGLVKILTNFKKRQKKPHNVSCLLFSQKLGVRFSLTPLNKRGSANVDKNL